MSLVDQWRLNGVADARWPLRAARRLDFFYEGGFGNAASSPPPTT